MPELLLVYPQYLQSADEKTSSPVKCSRYLIDVPASGGYWISFMFGLIALKSSFSYASAEPISYQNASVT